MSHLPSYAERLLGTKWTLPILLELENGPKRFSELERALAGITPRVLTERLRWLEAEGAIERSVSPANGRVVSYFLAPRGQRLGPILHAIRNHTMDEGAF